MVAATKTPITAISNRPSSLCRTVLNMSAPSSRDPDGRRGAPDGEAQEEVQQRDRDDRGPHRPPDGHADTGRAAAGPVAEVAVRHDDHDAEHQDLAEGPQHVLRWQEQVEVV